MRRIKEVLVINTITVPSYFNAGHHLPIFQVAQYLREHNDDIGVTCRDIGVLNYTWKDFSSLVFQGQFDLICIMIDFDTADSLERMLYYLKSLSKDSKVLLFGRMCKNNPDIFMITNVDAIAFEGDYETSVDSYIDYYNGTIDQPYGCIYRKDEKWEKSGESRILSPKDWAFPNLSEIPYDDYSKLYLNDSNKFCGIPNKKELVVNVSRGCPINCEFCDVAKMQGTIDRRVSPKELHDYIINNFTKYGFDYVSMYSAIFTLNKKWLKEFTGLMRNEAVPWKCVTTIEHLSDEDIELMHEAGCVRISIGVETLTPNNPNL